MMNNRQESHVRFIDGCLPAKQGTAAKAIAILIIGCIRRRSTSPQCAGASNAITGNSSRKDWANVACVRQPTSGATETFRNASIDGGKRSVWVMNCLAASLQSRPQRPTKRTRQPAVAVFSVTEVSDDLMEI